jgi:hypothetical protein
MFLTHTNSVYSEDTILLDHIPYPQYVHQVGNGGGFAVKQGMRIMPGELINYVLKGQHGAAIGTYQFIQSLTQLEHCKVGLILAAGGNSWTGYLSSISRTNQYPEHKMPPLGGTMVHAGYVANRIGSFDYISTDSSSCISGHSAWYTARNMLTLEQLDAVVIIAADNALSEDYLAIFGEHGLSKLIHEEDDPSITKFRLGQGCNISVFESNELIQSNEHQPLAKIIDMHIAAESHPNPLGISNTGEGYKKVINTVDTNDINFVKMHSTFSSDNKIEEEIIKDTFGDIKLINYKLRIGHTMGASTAIETALAVQEESGTFLSLGAGMGNVFSSAVVEIL